MLKVGLISKRCSSWLYFSNDCFMQKCCFLLLTIAFCVILFFTLDLGKMEVLRNMLRICLFFEHVGLNMLNSFMCAKMSVSIYTSNENSV